VLEVADGMTLTTLLWANGTFTYFNSMRCFHEQGTPEYAADLARSVSQIVQFMQANQIEQPLELIYLAGIDPADMTLYHEVLGQHGVNVPVRLFETAGIKSAGFEVQRSLHPLAGLYTAGKRQNFLKQYGKTRRKGNGEEKIPKELIIVGSTLVAVLAILAVMTVIKTVKSNNLKEIQSYNESPDVAFSVANFETLQYRNAFLSAQLSTIDSLDENIVTYPIGNTDVLNVIEKCAGDYAEVSFQSFDAEGGTISMIAQADTVDNINKFIRVLSEQDIFDDIKYTGYDFQETDGLWDINVSCTLAEAAGRQVSE
jgi:hypothetical protein